MNLRACVKERPRAPYLLLVPQVVGQQRAYGLHHLELEILTRVDEHRREGGERALHAHEVLHQPIVARALAVCGVHPEEQGGGADGRVRQAW